MTEITIPGADPSAILRRTLEQLVEKWRTEAIVSLQKWPRGAILPSKKIRACADELARVLTEQVTPLFSLIPLPVAPREEPVTACCAEPIGADRRFCPRCGYEARVIEGDTPPPAEQVEANAALEAITQVLNGESVSEFMSSFPIVRQVEDLVRERYICCCDTPPPDRRELLRELLRQIDFTHDAGVTACHYPGDDAACENSEHYHCTRRDLETALVAAPRPSPEPEKEK